MAKHTTVYRTEESEAVFTRELSGEYLGARGGESLETANARLILVEITKEILPEMFNDLRDLVQVSMKAYWPKKHLNAVLKDGDIGLDHILEPNWDYWVAFEPENYGTLGTALLCWADKFNVSRSEVWFLQWALRTARHWCEYPDALVKLEPWRFAGGWSNTMRPPERRFEFSDEGWSFELQKWTDFEKYIRCTFERKIADYQKVMRARANSLRLKRARRTYSKANFEQFIAYQFGGKNSTTIANEKALVGEKIDESTILKGVKTASGMVGWQKLRKGKRKQES